MPSSVHEPLASTFIEQFGVVKERLSPAIAKQMRVVGGQTIGAFHGLYQSSRKEADVLFKHHPPNGPISYTCAIEVGFAERYEDLVEDIKLWIEGGHVRMVILINVEEAPLYRCPTRALQDDEIEALDLPAIPALTTSMVSLEDQTDRFGPLHIRGLTWVNKMRAFLEIWKPDGITGNAKQQGDRKVSYCISTYTTCTDSLFHCSTLSMQTMKLGNLILNSAISILLMIWMEEIRGFQ